MFRRAREGQKTIRAVVMEVEGRDAVVLTADGDFRRVRLERAGYRVGEEIALPARTGYARGGRRPFFYGSFAFAAAAAFALALVVARPPQGERPGAVMPPASVAEAVMAYVSIDINPSAELGVDGRGLVVTARALNRDAVSLLRTVPYRLRPLDAVIGDLTEAAVREGFLAREKENAVLIAAVPARPGDALPPTVSERVYAGEQRARRVLENRGIDGAVAAAQVRHAGIRAEAERLDLSVGKYLIMLEARGEGLDIAPAELRNQAVGRVFQAHGVKPGEIIRRTAERDDEDWDRLAAALGAQPQAGGGGQPKDGGDDRTRERGGDGGRSEDRGRLDGPSGDEHRRDEGGERVRGSGKRAGEREYDSRGGAGLSPAGGGILPYRDGQGEQSKESERKKESGQEKAEKERSAEGDAGAWVEPSPGTPAFEGGSHSSGEARGDADKGRQGYSSLHGDSDGGGDRHEDD